MKSSEKNLIKQEVHIPCGNTMLVGDLTFPHEACSTVFFVNGSGNSRKSPWARIVADALHRAGLATVLLNLLTPEEEREDALAGSLRLDIPLLSHRLIQAIDWFATQSKPCPPVGCFGINTGAAAVLRAAAERPDIIRAVVLRNGRPDLAGKNYLKKVHVPVLCIVGEHHPELLVRNHWALSFIPTENQELLVIPATPHLPQETVAVDKIAAETMRWFKRYGLLHCDRKNPVVSEGHLFSV